MKKFICILLSLIISAFCVVPSFAVENSQLTYFYLDKGKIVIGDGEAKGYDYFGNQVSIFDEDGYFITQSTDVTTANTITFTGGKNYVVFSNLKINISSQFVCAVNVADSSDVTVNLQNDNVIVSGSSRAGIEVSTDSSLTVEGNGSLKAGSYGQAGIGGGNAGSCGNITINSGNILAQSVNESAGIGGGSSGNNGSVTINGGNVTAIGGSYGAGIGGGNTGNGGTVTINGGTVTATGGTSAAGIGGGWYGSMGTVIINGGSVKATGGSKAPAIGSGAGLSSGKIYNDNGDVVYPVKVSTTVTDVNEIYTNGKENNIGSFHSNDKSFYFYLPSGEHIIAVDSLESPTEFYKALYSSSFSVSKITPFECVGSCNVGDDDVIRGLSCSLSSLDGYLNLNNGFAFSYESEIIATGSVISLLYNNKEIFSYKALIYGDVDSDGFYDARDGMLVSLIYWEHIHPGSMDDIYFEAADADRNGVINTLDAELLQQAGLLLSSVPQVENGSVNVESDQWIEYVSLVDQTPPEEPSEDQTDESDNGIADIILKLIYSLIIIIFELFKLV